MFSSPFLGTFFQYVYDALEWYKEENGFRPLSWGLSFNMYDNDNYPDYGEFSSPFLGTFFQ